MDVMLYDGSYAGFFTAVFEAYEYKFKQPVIKRETVVNAPLFGLAHNVVTNINKAKRVMLKLQTLLKSSGLQKLYSAYLSDEPDIENAMLRYVQYAILKNTNVEKHLTNADVSQIEQMAKKVGREAHRMTGFIRFRLSADGLYFATIETDHNVLPLIVKHFKDRFANQQWLIYDLKRKYGVHYNLQQIEEVLVDFNNENSTATMGLSLHEEEGVYETLWKQYYKSTNIDARKNKKLHIQQLPKRYWKHLSEKID